MDKKQNLIDRDVSDVAEIPQQVERPSIEEVCSLFFPLAYGRFQHLTVGDNSLVVPLNVHHHAESAKLCNILMLRKALTISSPRLSEHKWGLLPTIMLPFDCFL